MKGFWSLTMYDAEHYFYPNALKRYALGTKNKTLKYNADGGLTIYGGNKSPGRTRSPTGCRRLLANSRSGSVPTGPISHLDATWMPPVVSRLQ